MLCTCLHTQKSLAKVREFVSTQTARAYILTWSTLCKPFVFHCAVATNYVAVLFLALCVILVISLCVYIYTQACIYILLNHTYRIVYTGTPLVCWGCFVLNYVFEDTTHNSYSSIQNLLGSKQDQDGCTCVYHC